VSPQIQKTRPRAVAEGGVRRGRGVEGLPQQPARERSCSKTFDTAGTFNYHCSIHPSMKGQVIVEK